MKERQVELVIGKYILQDLKIGCKWVSVPQSFIFLRRICGEQVIITINHSELSCIIIKREAYIIIKFSSFTYLISTAITSSFDRRHQVNKQLSVIKK